jgi:hypothetical protein
MLSLCMGILEIAAALVKWRSLYLFKICGVSRDQGNASCAPYQNCVRLLQRPIFITIEDYSDSGASSESEYESDKGSTSRSDCDTDLDPELSE